MLRSLSSVSVAGFAGCVTGDSGSGNDRDTTARSKQVSVNEERELAFSVRVLQSFTDDHPGRIRIALTNGHENPLAMGISHGIEGPVSVIYGARQDGEEELIILADPAEEGHETPPGAPCRSGEYAIPSTPPNGCWQPACEFATMRSHYAITLPAGATLSWPYVVLDGFNETCLPAGTYEFVETAPITTVRTTDISGTTPPDGWSMILTKRVQLTLESDGTLTADEQLETTSRDT